MLKRTAAFALVFAAAVIVARTLHAPGTDLALFWPAAGVSALWSLLLRSRREAFLAGTVAAAVLLPSFLSTGFTWPAAVLMTLANLTIFLGTRLMVDSMQRRRPFVHTPDHPAWQMTNATHATILITASGAATLASIPLAWAALEALHTPFSADDAVAHLFQNMASVVLIAGTGTAVLAKDAPGAKVSRGFLAAVIVAPLLIAAIIFSPFIQIPLLYASLLPLFWTAMRFKPSIAMAYTVALAVMTVTFLLTVSTNPVGINANEQVVATRFQLFCVVTGTLSLVISTAMARMRRLRATLQRSEHAARTEASRLATVTATVPDGLAIVHADGHAEPLNGLVPGYLQRDAESVYHLPARVTALDGVEIPPEERPCALALKGHASRDVPIVVGLDDGTRRIFEVGASPIRTTNDDVAALLSFRDATARYRALEERAQVQAVLAHQARHDALTGLLNRAGFEAALAERTRLWHDAAEDAGLLLLDLDNFKLVNDTLGHATGDELLVVAAEALRSAVRHNDVVARLGGDEFAVLLPGANL